MTGPGRYAQVAVDVRPAHLDRPFDYAVPDGWDVRVGQRVRVVFAGRRRDGWVVGLRDWTDAERVLPIARQQGILRWFDADDLVLFRWVADRWAGTLADVLRHALPPRVAAEEQAAPPAPGAVRPQPATSGAETWDPYGAEALLAAVDGSGPPGAFWLRPLPGDETELVLDLVARTVAADRAALVLTPDPASPVADAALRIAGDASADLRGHRSDRQRYRAFLRARAGTARVVVGERGAALAPVPRLALVVVEDEANPAYKERRSPRHNARDVALGRARMAGATAVLTSDVPSASLWRFVGAGHVVAVRADRASEQRAAPRVEVVDTTGSRTRFSDAASRALGAAVAAGGAAIVLAARGGQGAALACQACRRRLLCPRCDGSLRVQRDADERECPACGWTGPPTPCVCGGEKVVPLAAGAGRLAQELARSYPEAEVARMEGFDAEGPASRPAIGVMTRGSVVERPRWLHGGRAKVLVVPDADAMRGRADLEAAEDALRLWMAAARAADRVVLQTRDPRDAVVQALVRWDPDGFWEREQEWRAALGFPPVRSLVRVVARPDDAGQVAAELREALAPSAAEGLPDEVLGPDPDGACLVKTADLRGTLQLLRPLRAAWGRDDRRVRVDVDPVPAG